ncbi:MAG: ATP-binding cassette domain-containing protein [Bauldia sp.]
MERLIEVASLRKRFGSVLAVNDVSFAVNRGEVLGFLGPNGAGKSTTMKVITGYLPPTAGTAIICGQDIRTSPVAAKRRMGYLPEGAPLYGDMTPEGFLDFVAAMRGLSGPRRKQRIEEVTERMGLGEVYHRRIDTLSKGFRRRVGLAQAIVHDPDVLILDEPTDGLDPNQKHDVRTLIRSMGGTKAIIISTHILEEVDAVCDRAIIIDHGRLVTNGTPMELHAMARTHNAVALRVKRSDVERAVSFLKVLPDVETVEIGAAVDGGMALTVVPKGGKFIADQVGVAVRSHDLAISEIHSEPGKLDDVFRAVTKH